MTSVFPWTETFALHIHEISFASAVLFPLLRICVQKTKNGGFSFPKKSGIIHDFANGLAFPTLLVLTAFPIFPNAIAILASEPHVLQIAGVIGSVHIASEIFS